MNKMMKTLSIALSLLLVAGGTGAAFALAKNAQTEQSVVETTQQPADHPATQTGTTEKDETVYVLAGADGSVKKIIVSDWIKNELNASSISDFSELHDIEAVKGDSSYASSGENVKVWDTQGNDVCYQGNIEKELPVDMSVTYTLNGKELSAEEMAGKSGRVTIRFDYENRQYETVQIDGAEQKIYVPFVMLTGMLLDNSIFRNVEVSNGKFINDGERTAVIGIAFPGLQEDLGIGSDMLELPDYVEITADVTDFSFGMTISVATNEIFNALDMGKLNSINDLTGSVGELTNAMGMLMDGSSALYDGLYLLLDKSGELVDGVDKLASAAKIIKTGIGGVLLGDAQLKAGIAGLTIDLRSLSREKADLLDSAEQGFAALLKSANTRLAAAGIEEVPELTAENYDEVLDGLVNAGTHKTSTWFGIQFQGVESQGGGIALTTEEQEMLIALKAELDSYASFCRSLKEYTDDVSSAALKATGLSAGTTMLTGGGALMKITADLLYDGIGQMQDGIPALVDGVTQLKDGAMQLSDGLKQFNEQGIQKIVDLLDGDVTGLVNRLKATVEVSKRYRNFSGISEEMDGQVKFIYRTEEVVTAAK